MDCHGDGTSASVTDYHKPFCGLYGFNYDAATVSATGSASTTCKCDCNYQKPTFDDIYAASANAVTSANLASKGEEAGFATPATLTYCCRADHTIEQDAGFDYALSTGAGSKTVNCATVVCRDHLETDAAQLTAWWTAGKVATDFNEGTRWYPSTSYP